MKSIFKKFLCVMMFVVLYISMGAIVSAKSVLATLSLKYPEDCERFEKGGTVTLYVGKDSVKAKVKNVGYKVFVDCSDIGAYVEALENPLAQSCRGAQRPIQLEPVEESVAAFVTVEYDDCDVPPIFSSDFACRTLVGRNLECFQSGKKLRDSARYSGIVDARLWMLPFASDSGVKCSYRYC